MYNFYCKKCGAHARGTKSEINGIRREHREKGCCLIPIEGRANHLARPEIARYCRCRG